MAEPSALKHNSTSEKQGGSEELNEFYHLTLQQIENLDNLSIGAVLSVTGDLVDNTDPTNPVILIPNFEEVITQGGNINTSLLNNDGDGTSPFATEEYVSETIADLPFAQTNIFPIAGTVRCQETTPGVYEWVIVENSSGAVIHQPINVVSITTPASYEGRVNYDMVDAVGSMNFTPDEDYALYGLSAIGASINQTQATFRVGKTGMAIAVERNAGAWSVVAGDVVRPDDFAFLFNTTTGELRITASAYPFQSGNDFIDVKPRNGSTLTPVVVSQTATQVFIKFLDSSGNQVMTASDEMDFSLSRSGSFRVSNKALAHLNGNFWFVGLHQKAGVTGMSWDYPIDSLPIEGSTNLVTSGGVYSAISGLIAINEGNGIGWRFKGRDATKYGNIGLNATDLSNSTVAEGILAMGAMGESSYAEGTNTRATGKESHAQGQFTLASGAQSHAEGFSTESTGIATHAEGYLTKAIGNYSHSEGNTTRAEGMQSHAEGFNTIASGVSSHAEGTNNIASGNCAHVEGQQNTATGDWSHAEGEHTDAIGMYSHTEGANTEAHGVASHAQGQGNEAMSYAEHAGGAWGTIYTAASTTEVVGTDRLVNYGNGTDSTNKSDAFTLLKNGLLRLPSVTNTLIDGADGKAVTTKEWVSNAISSAGQDLQGVLTNGSIATGVVTSVVIASANNTDVKGSISLSSTGVSLAGEAGGISINGGTTGITITGETDMYISAGMNLYGETTEQSVTFHTIAGYQDNYSANFTNRSLVDKEYVDNTISSSSQDLQDVLDNGSEATITSPFNIDTAGFGFNITNGSNGAIWGDAGVGITIAGYSKGVTIDGGVQGISINGGSGDIAITSGDIQIAMGTVPGGITVQDFNEIKTGGIRYVEDYSASYTDRSLVDKEYVDNAVNSSNLNPHLKTDSYTFIAGDEGRVLEIESALDTIVTVPEDASVNFPVGTQLLVTRVGEGEIEIVGEGGVSLKQASGFYRISNQWDVVALYKRAEDEWVLTGNFKP